MRLELGVFSLTSLNAPHKVSSVKKSPFRIIAALLLVVSLLTLSGLTSTAGALINASAANSCCDSGCDDAPKSGPCSTPDCPCFSCISMVMALSLTVLRDSANEIVTYASKQHFHLCEFIPSIEYPPEAA